MERSKITPIQQRINEKRSELESLTQLKEFSGILAKQLEQLEDKLNSMADGTEAVATVLANWHNIIKSVSLASMGLVKYTDQSYQNLDDPPLPETLVRIRLNQEEQEE